MHILWLAMGSSFRRSCRPRSASWGCPTMVIRNDWPVTMVDIGGVREANGDEDADRGAAGL